MRVGVVGLDVHGGAVPHRALDHRGDLGGGAVDQLGVDGQGLLLHVPVDEHPAAAVARVPLGEQVLVVGADVGGVGGDRGRALAPQLGAAGGEGGVRDLDGDGASGLGGQIAAAHVAQLVLGVAVAAGRHGLDPGVRAVRVDRPAAGVRPATSGERLPPPETEVTASRQPVRSTASFSMSMSGTMPHRALHLALDPAQVARLGLGLGRGQPDRPGLPLGDVQPAQLRHRVVEQRQFGGHLLAQLVDEHRRRPAACAARGSSPHAGSAKSWGRSSSGLRHLSAPTTQISLHLSWSRRAWKATTS